MRLLIPILIFTASAAAHAADTKTSTATATKTGTAIATTPATAPGATAKAAPAAKPPPLAAGEVINVNTADAATLERLPKVGKRLAAAIVAHREKNGPYVSADDLAKIKGIGPKRLAAIKPHAAVK